MRECRNVNKSLVGGPEVSIIVPVYKAERQLDKCLRSIEAQACPYFEVLLIDDGSPDRSGEICDAWAAKDARFRVIHQENAGVARARETGIKNARGRYIVWADADDWIEPELVEEVLSAFRESGAELVVFGTQDLTEDGTFTENFSKPERTAEEWLRAAVSANASVVWDFAAKRELWLDVKVPHAMEKSAEDGYMAIRLYMKATKVKTVSEILYHHVIDNPDSVGHTFTGRTYWGSGALWQYRMELCREKFPELERDCAGKAMSGLVKAFCLALTCGDLSDEELEELRGTLRELKPSSVNGRYRDKFLRWTILHGYDAPCRVYAAHKLKKVDAYRKRKEASRKQRGWYEKTEG